MLDSYNDLFPSDHTPLFTETTKSTKAKSGQWKLSAFLLFNVTYKTGRD